MNKLLVPIDGSDHSRRALTHAATFAKAAGASLHLLYVCDDYDDAERAHAYRSIEGLIKPAQERGAALLKDALTAVEAMGVSASSEVLVGPVARTIATRAKELGCDGIVMGTHGRGFLANVLMGSMARKVLAMTDLPVMLVK